MPTRVAAQAFVALALLFTAGCAVFGSSKDRAMQKDPNFRDGYQDGCAAATDQGSDLRDRTVGDRQLLADNDAYRAGWSSGFQTCRRSDMTPNAMPGDNPMTLPGPGH
ncbi:MAG TPA: hypothetical protein VKR31_18000 [Rhizomicrobium sp.]|nr:hypothetical protein [Rhizomicrobium sp.]